MKGPPPKNPALRQRANKTSTRSTLPSEREAATRKVPPLGPCIVGEWHPFVLERWAAGWRSPMAAEWLDADKPRLIGIMYLWQAFITSVERGQTSAKAMTEIRQQEEAFGFTPIARRRLEWRVPREEEDAAQTKPKRARRRGKNSDPRKVLRVV